VVRADIDLAALTPTSTEPVGAPVAGTYWVDTASTLFGIKEWNSSTQAFTVKTPVVLDDTTPTTSFSGTAPAVSVGQIGDYAMVVTNGNTNNLYYKKSDNTWASVTDGFETGKALQISPHYTYPTFNSTTATGSVWVTTTTPSTGANWSVKVYNGSSQSWTTVTAPIYSSILSANYTLDQVGGGKNIAVGTVFIESSYNHGAADVGNFKLWRKSATGATTAVSNLVTTQLTTSSSFTIRETLPSGAWSSVKTVSLTSIGNSIGSQIPAGISGAGLAYTSASWDSSTNVLTITHSGGGAIELYTGPETVLNSFFTAGTTANVFSAPTGDFTTGTTPFTFIVTNWSPLVYEARSDAPTTIPADGAWWNSSVVDEVDILIHNGTTWVGMQHSSSQFYNTGLDQNGPIISATEPDKATGQSDGTALVAGDIWVDTSDIDQYGRNIYVYSGTAWVKQDVTDQSTPTGWLFADARWATAGSATDPSTIIELRTSSYLDPDCPDPALYPRGMRLWNTRRSCFNVKQ
jgi:hypothetical protein